MGNILLGIVYNVRIYVSNTEGLSDLEDNTTEQHVQQMTPCDFVLVLVIALY